MTIQTTFSRYEVKYLLTNEQRQLILNAIMPYMQIDSYGHTTIRNIYFDTPDYLLIRRSIEKPIYKEKLRIRSYKAVAPDEKVFVELKKKYNSVVYKRRLTVEDSLAKECFENNLSLPVHSQIGSEIDYFRQYYSNLKPAVFLSYEREAFYGQGSGDLRITLDENICYRNRDFSLGSEIYGDKLLADGMCLMEIKTSGGMPLWLCNALTDGRIFRTSFSKYGEAYRQMLKNKIIYISPNEERSILYA